MIEKEAKEDKSGFLSISLGILGASLLGNMLAGKGVTRAGKGSQGRSRCVVLPHPLTNLEMESIIQNKPRFNGVYSRTDSPKITNLDKYNSIGSH